MTNHYHLYLSTPNANLSKFIKALNQSYAMYFLNKYKDKDGKVFKSRFMRKLVEDDVYSKSLIAYVHNNPYKLVSKIYDWKYSSYQSYIDSEARFDFIDYDFTFSNFANSEKSFIEFHDYMRRIKWDPEDYTVAKTFIGGENFVQKIAEQYLDFRLIHNEEIRGMSYFRNRMKEEIPLKISSAVNLDEKLRLKFELYVLKEYYGYSLKELELRYKKRAKTISEIIRRFKVNLSKSKELKFNLDRFLECGIVET